MRIHLIGIKGVGMTALAQILQSRGHQLSGSDVAEDFQTKYSLDQMNIPITEFNPDNITPDIEQIIYSVAYGPDHPELQKAHELNIQTIKYPEALADIFNKSRGIAVTGTHGKTSTSAMLGHVLATAELDPTVLVGAPVINFDKMSARSPSLKLQTASTHLFVIEACEYRHTFLNYKPHLALITNIDYDHPDCYSCVEDYNQGFAKFTKNIDPDGLLVIREQDLIKTDFPGKTSTFALDSPTADFTARSIELENHKYTFTVLKNKEEFGEFQIQVPGHHNIENALGVITVCDYLNLNPEQINKGLQTYLGAVRRQEVRGEKDGVLVIDDYGHHPDEIRNTIKALREFYPQRRMVVVFQSHTHTRTRELLDDFATSFDDADLLFITEMFPSAREQDYPHKVMPEELAEVIHQHNPDLEIIAGDPMLTHEEIQKYAQKIKPYLKSGDLLLTLGAGETDKLADSFLSQ